MTDGIYTLANDTVIDHLIALLNSIEVNVSSNIPVCVIPFNHELNKVRAEIAQRPQVSLLEDTAAIRRWEDFATRIWASHRKAQQMFQKRNISGIYQLERHRKLCCFDGPFERFIFFDADTLALGSLDQVFKSLENHDWINHDFQHRSDLNYVFDETAPQLRQIFTEQQLKTQIFCSGWFASKKDVFTTDKLSQLLDQLLTKEINVLAWDRSDQTVLNYLVLRSGISYHNIALTPEGTGTHWISQFEQRDGLLYDRGMQLTYLHYMSISSEKIAQLCQGEAVDIPYRDLFLHYRYLKHPQDRPALRELHGLARLHRRGQQMVQQQIHPWFQLQGYSTSQVRLIVQGMLGKLFRAATAKIR
uniref:Sugar transferase n=1 Tax=Cyanothece sp. (strain PCC 7425 / ATCC 29141) TaxID=395961 RepID=B8HT84_CYAP4